MTRPTILPVALYAAALGWPVFPLTPGGKLPVIRAAHPAGHPCRGGAQGCGRFGHGFHDATTDPETITAWWRRWPAANYGIATGPADLVVIDLDTGKGTAPVRVLPDQGDDEPRPGDVADGADVLAWAADRDGAPAGWGDTFTVRTPSGGTHLYYAAPTSTSGEPGGGVGVRSSVGHSGGRITGLGWSIDVRAVGGYVVGPGSLTHRTGRPGPAGGYAVINRGPVEAVPGWVLTRLRAIGAGRTTTPCNRASAGGRAGRAAGVRVGGGGYGRAALAGELAAIAAADPGAVGGGGRNDTVNRAAYKLGRIIDAARLDPDQVTAELLAAATAVGLSAREAGTAIASGLAQGRANPRTIHRPAHRTSTSGGPTR